MFCANSGAVLKQCPKFCYACGQKVENDIVGGNETDKGARGAKSAHTKRQVHKMHVFKMFITVVCLIFLIKLRWPKTKSLYA